MFYRQPEPLNPEVHGKLGVSASDHPFRFAAKSQAVPLTVGEFGPASLSYPIVFAGPDYQPLAVMSIRADENLFITPAGQFDPTAYIPAFIRRYPFVYAQGDEDPDRMIVCIDRAAETINDHPQAPFFVDGEPSDFTKACMKFCSDFEGERRKTEDFVKLLRDLDLFEVRTVSFTPANPDGTAGQTVKVSDHFSPSEEKVQNLPESIQLDLLRNGAMQQIHLHWNSLFNWERIINETSRRLPVPANSQG